MQQYGQPPPQGQPPHGAYGHPQQPQHPGYGHGQAYAPPGPQGYGPAPGYGMGPDPRVKDLNDQSNTWMIVAILGFWFGFGFITGPLAWIKGARLRSKYRELGLSPSGTATAAWIVGIVSTAAMALAVLAVVWFVAMLGMAVSASAAGGL